MNPEPPTMNPVVEPLSWMLGTWLSDPPGYLEEVCISHMGQPVLNFSFNPFHPDTRKPMHRECDFIRLKPSAQNTVIVEVEEGKVKRQELCITSHSIARISFAKELNSEGKLEQTVSMATTTQPMTQHVHITYKRVTL
ncbi:unnamed protein product [Nyctereutes procyonoides]|uniref:(raccoon dog) hypothetical protein n=1 Tax=Nyctereutes procyonoides TaxID=34880 RepID=A0A811Y3Z7_NYCPR|nr:unnamed protein product [Nyctereutes procyonoides]